MRNRKILYVLLAAVIILILFSVRGCYHAIGSAEQEIYTSPEGSNTIIVRYDMMSRPSVYKKMRFRKKKIWKYPGSGFMETVHFGVEWLSEDEIRLEYDDVNHDEYDEEYMIHIPE